VEDDCSTVRITYTEAEVRHPLNPNVEYLLVAIVSVSEVHEKTHKRHRQLSVTVG
jgi:hypothetical protein